MTPSLWRRNGDVQLFHRKRIGTDSIQGCLIQVEMRPNTARFSRTRAKSSAWLSPAMSWSYRLEIMGLWITPLHQVYISLLTLRPLWRLQPSLRKPQCSPCTTWGEPAGQGTIMFRTAEFFHGVLQFRQKCSFKTDDPLASNCLDRVIIQTCWACYQLRAQKSCR